LRCRRRSTQPIVRYFSRFSRNHRGASANGQRLVDSSIDDPHEAALLERCSRVAVDHHLPALVRIDAIVHKARERETLNLHFGPPKKKARLRRARVFSFTAPN